MNSTHEPTVQGIAAVMFALALVHTFAAKQFERLAHRYPKHAGMFELIGEVEVVFGFWAFLLVLATALTVGGASALAYAESRNYTEPLFVFVVMVVAAARPVLYSCEMAGAQGGSIGGTLTSYAAPPVLMVASAWQWDSAFMFATLGWKAALAVLVNATVCAVVLRRHVVPEAARPPAGQADVPVPKTVVAVHLGLLAGVVLLAHHPVAFLGLFLVFLGFSQAYARYQRPLIIREALLVAFFLAGLVVLGGMQSWWLQPIVSGLKPFALFVGSLGLTAITDNAALTYLGSQIAGMSDASKYTLVAGAVAGGGLTVIANAPNPAGVALLRHGFADQSIGAAGLLLGAIGPTLVAALAFLML